MLIDITEARAIDGHRLYLKFQDGVDGEVDLSEIVTFEGVFAPLKEPAEVAKVSFDPDLGTVCWRGGADLDPDVLYATLTGKAIALPETVEVG